MADTTPSSTPTPSGYRLGTGEDRHGERLDVGMGLLTFKVTTADSQGMLVVVELIHHARGGPARHRHLDQDEWFYVAEGRYLVAVGADEYVLGPGDSAFGPRGVPHTWAFTGGERGRLVLAVSPAGRIEPFLRALADVHAVAPQDPAFWPPYNLELVGPPLP